MYSVWIHVYQNMRYFFKFDLEISLYTFNKLLIAIISNTEIWVGNFFRVFPEEPNLLYKGCYVTVVKNAE